MMICWPALNSDAPPPFSLHFTWALPQIDEDQHPQALSGALTTKNTRLVSQVQWRAPCLTAGLKRDKLQSWAFHPDSIPTTLSSRSSFPAPFSPSSSIRLLSASTDLWLCRAKKTPTKNQKQGPCSLTGGAISSTLFQRTPGELGEPLKAQPSCFLLIQHAPVWVWEISLGRSEEEPLRGENPFCSYYWGMASHLLKHPLPPQPAAPTNSIDATPAGASTTRSLLAVCYPWCEDTESWLRNPAKGCLKAVLYF